MTIAIARTFDIEIMIYLRTKYLLIQLLLLLMIPLRGQNPPITLPADGNWPTIVGDSIMLIGPKQEALTEEQRYFNPPYLLVYPGKEHLKEQMIRAALCDCDPTKPNRRIGVFSVAPDKQVSFSQGNLQYLPSLNIWKFANTQYEYLGNANKYLKPTFRNWVDLFGWSANNTTAPFGVSTSTNVADYAGDFVDWGTNEICGDAPGTWRTLSADEWIYLLQYRMNADQLWALGRVGNVNGLILLPDTWDAIEGLHFSPNEIPLQNDNNYEDPSKNNHCSKNKYSLEDWRKMELEGAVFLPLAAYREGINWYNQQSCSYNASTPAGVIQCYVLRIYPYNLYPAQPYDRHIGRAVRLVHDTIVPKPEPEYVDLGLSVKWATFNVGATSPEDYGDYFAWGETETKDKYSWATYKWCQGTANTLTKYCSNGQYGNADYKTILDPEDDAAIVHWGSDWRMPTIDEWLELKQKCSWKKIIINGITGYQVTAKNDNSIFIPRAGLRMSDILYANDSVGYYASSSHLPEFSHEDYASYMLMYDNSISKSSTVRYYGLSIRPVYDDVPDPCMVVKVNDTLSINLMCVEGGTFMMGAMEGDEIAKDDEKPAHKVTLTYDYHIMQTEVTQSLWEAVMGEDIYVAQTKMANASKPAYVGGNYPMYYVRMNDALEFIDKLNAMTGMHFRLPTEAEWEYAARGGNKSKGYLYAGSNNADDVGWYTGRGGLHRVAQLKPNELGIYDISGNVGEMCLDYGTYGETYKAGDVVNPRGNIRANGNRFWRGGSYPHSKDSMRVSQRSSYTPSWGGTWLGLRLVLAEDNDFRTIRVGNSYFDMSFVKGGTFMMGSDASDAEEDEHPVHEVTLSDYYIGQTEVTQHLWKKVMGDENNPSATKGNNLPVTNITWDEAQVFVERLSELTGMRFRLPTEAEWEYAARGGQKSKGYTYAGSDDIDEVAWYAGNSGNKLHSIGEKSPNELGIFDMTGNAWEWCQDWYGAYSTEAQVNPTGPNFGSSRVLRSGSYTTTIERCTAKFRQARQANYPDTHIGLRIVLEPEKHYRYGYTQEAWDAATSSWGHQGRGHAPADQSCIQGTMVHGIRLKVARGGSLNVYKVPSLLEKTEDHFELVATLTTNTTGVQDFDFTEPIYIAPNEYLVLGKPSEAEPTLRPCWFSGNGNSLPDKSKGVAHYIGTEEASIGAPSGSLMVEFY